MEISVVSFDVKKFDKIKSKAPIFIVGCQRSGTSFLYRVFDEVLDIGFGRDNTLFLKIDNTLSNKDFNIPENLSQLLSYFDSSLVFKKRFPGIQLNKQEFKSLLTDDLSYANIIRSIYGYWSLSQGKSGWGGKTPDYTAYQQELFELFPDIKIIHIVRDGRDVASSLNKLSWGPNDPIVAANYWMKRVQTGSEGNKLLPTENYIEIKYEDFLEKPIPEFKKLIEFVDVADRKEVLETFENTIIPKIKSGNCYKWKRSFTDYEKAVYEAVAGDVLKHYNYEVSGAGKKYKRFIRGILIFHNLKNLISKVKDGAIKRKLSSKVFKYKFDK